MMPLKLNEISDDFDTVKTSSHMLKLDTETSTEVLHAIIDNMELQTNLTSKIVSYKRKNKAEIFSEKVIVGSQKSKISIYVEKIKNTKNTYQISYDIDLPSRPFVTIFVLLMFLTFIVIGQLVGLGIAAILYMAFSMSDKTKIQKVFPIKSIIHDAILKLEKEAVE